MPKIRWRSFEAELKSGDDLISSALESKIPLKFGCRSGSCGACCHVIYQGMECLADPDPIELHTLRAMPSTTPTRLACRAMVLDRDGIIEVENYHDLQAKN